MSIRPGMAPAAKIDKEGPQGNGQESQAVADQAARQALNLALMGHAKAVAEKIRPEWLTHSRQLILKAALAAEQEGWQPDPVAIRDWLSRRGDLSTQTVEECLKALELPGVLANLDLYAGILERWHRGRRAHRLALEIGAETDPAKRAELGVELAATSASRLEAGPENSDAGNADRLLAAAAGRLRHCPDLGEGEKGWLWWNGNHWERRARDRAYALLTASTRERLRNVHAEDKSGARFVHGSLAESRLRAAIRLAEMRPGVTIRGTELDSDPWLLTCGNGTLDLGSGELREPAAQDHITRHLAVPLDMEARAPRWEKFLTWAMGSRGRLVEYLQLAVGYSLTGSTREQVFFLLYGTGANGKSTFIEVVTALLGEYAYAAPFETFAMTHNRASERDMFPLRAARLVTSVEAESGQRLAESFIKRATGGDTVTGRALFAETINFVPQFKLWLAANHLPEIRGTDEAIWRRVRLIPFEVTVPEAERDPELKEKLKAELPGILRWAVKGCYAWGKIGMPKVAEVTAATSAYREEQDWIGEFLRDVCTTGDGYECNSSVLYSAFKKWAEANGVTKPPSQKKLVIALKERGLRNYRNASGMQWRGIGVM